MNSWCGTGYLYCSAPSCQIEYGPGCDANVRPSGPDTTNVARPKIGSIPYGQAIYRCNRNGDIALTYDDGPYTYTEDLLDLLQVSHLPKHILTATDFTDLQRQSNILHHRPQPRQRRNQRRSNTLAQPHPPHGPRRPPNRLPHLVPPTSHNSISFQILEPDDLQRDRLCRYPRLLPYLHASSLLSQQHYHRCLAR